MSGERLLTDRAVHVADHIISHLNGLPLDEGLSVLISILAATLNGQAGDETAADALWSATCHDLRETMKKGRDGVLTEGTIQ